MDLPTSTGGERLNQRRSQRVLLSVPVEVVAQRPDKEPLSEATRTVVVNAHGALVLLALKVSIGQLLTLKHGKTEEEQACRVVNVAPGQAGKSEVGVEFMKPNPRFWRIAFPPEDWSSRSPEAKTARPQTAPQRPLGPAVQKPPMAAPLKLPLPKK